MEQPGKFRRIATILALAALFALTFATYSHADPVGYRVEFVNGFGVHIVQVNLGSPSVKISPILASTYPGGAEPMSTICARERPIAAITGTFFSRTSKLPIGDIMIDGRLVHFGGMGSALAITPDNEATFRRIPWGRKQDWGPFETVLAGGPMLLENGAVALAPAHEKFQDPHVLGRASRTAIGLTAKNKLLLVATRESVSLWELAKIMKGLGCTEAINLDGGSSTGLYYRGSTIIKPGRSLVNVLAVYCDVDPNHRVCQADRINRHAEVASYRSAKAYEVYLKAQVPLARGQLDEAVRLLTRATELDPDNASFHQRLAETLAKTGDALGAAACWTRAGKILLMKQQFGPALTCFEAALEHDPENQSAKVGRPEAYRGLGMLTQARAAEAELAFEALADRIMRTDLLTGIVREAIELARMPVGQ